MIEHKKIGGLLKGRVKCDGEGVNDKHTNLSSVLYS